MAQVDHVVKPGGKEVFGGGAGEHQKLPEIDTHWNSIWEISLSGFTRKASVYAGCGGFSGTTNYHNSRRTLRLLQVLHLRPSGAQAQTEPPVSRPLWRCACGGVMVILRRRMRPDALAPCTAPPTEWPDKASPVEVVKH
jgi:hypothetical protein